MITTGDIKSILSEDLKKYGFKTYLQDTFPDGEITDERIIIRCGELSPGTYWESSYAHLNICVPDLYGMADTKRLTEIERMFKRMKKTFRFDGSVCRYMEDGTSQEKDEALKCHFVNVRLLFEMLNVNY